MTFKSILFSSRGADNNRKQPIENMPDFFRDLNLDQVIQSIVEGKEQYNLKPLFYQGPVSMETIDFRHEVFRDLESQELVKHLVTFAGNMRKVKTELKDLDRYFHQYQKERLFIDIVQHYCQTIIHLNQNLSDAVIKSEGLQTFREYLAGYVKSDRLQSLVREIKTITSELSSVRYNIVIDGLRVQVIQYEDEIDYSQDVEKTFAKFSQAETQNYLSDLPKIDTLNDVEALVLEGVKQLFPDYFLRLSNFYEQNQKFIPGELLTFEREIQFYISFLAYRQRFEDIELEFCYPHITASKNSIYCRDSFDLALANNLLKEGNVVVTNGFHLSEKERVLIITGPNQGGKTTFARTFGQMHFLGSIGCPVAGKEAQLFLYDQMFTHFEREEDMKNLRGKLLDELVRIHEILQKATSDTIIVINEIFTSTTLQDQIFLSSKVMQEIMGLDLFSVWVTFIDELASFSDKTISMISTVVSDNPAERTFKIKRQAADGLAYAISVAEKYQLTYELLKERLSHECVPVK